MGRRLNELPTKQTLVSGDYLIGHDGTGGFRISGTTVGTGGGGGVADHGQLTGLSDDDHPQYYNQTRGDQRYSQLSHTHTTLASVDITTLRLSLGGGQYVKLVPVFEDGVPNLKLVFES